MKISYNWLKEFVDIKKTPDQLAEDLSLFGHNAETVEPVDNDTVLDLEITPNRGDCLSILGIAREVAALYELKLIQPKAEITEEKIDKKIEVEIEKPEICSRFTARIIDNIKIGESSKEIQEKLATYGFRPINNIVDATNYVMVATGQPLHAFDYDKIKNGLIRIRQAKKDEEVMTLDGQNRILSDGDVIIEDEEKIYDLAGIMGGFKSEVDDKTKTIILQGAIFDSVLIRKASKHLNHTTDASYRYERGVDSEGTILGVDLAAKMIKNSCPEAKVAGLIDIQSETAKTTKIPLDIEKVIHLLGINIKKEDAFRYLERLGFKISGAEVSVPSHRSYDVKIWQDLAEEIARMYGYNQIAKNQIAKSKSQNLNKDFSKSEKIKDVLVDLGFTESYSYSFAEKEKIELLGQNIDECVEIANPLSEETQYLRPSLLVSLLETISRNPWAPEINIFEMEAVFAKTVEKWQLGIATVGKSDLSIQEALNKLGLKADIRPVEQKILDALKIRRPVRFCLIDLDDINLKALDYLEGVSPNKYKKISKFPPTVRDLAFVVAKDANIENITKSIADFSENILLVEVFDDYLLKDGSRNVAFHLWLQDLKGPLADNVSQKIIQEVVSKVQAEFQIKLRSK